MTPRIPCQPGAVLPYLKVLWSWVHVQMIRLGAVDFGANCIGIYHVALMACADASAHVTGTASGIVPLLIYCNI